MLWAFIIINATNQMYNKESCQIYTLDLRLGIYAYQAQKLNKLRRSAILHIYFTPLASAVTESGSIIA